MAKISIDEHLSNASITEWGAAETVPGSKMILRIGKDKHLIDAGSEFEREEDDSIYVFPFKIGDIRTTTFTHAHFDHIGRYLDLVAQGYCGPTYSTYQTADLCSIQLNQQQIGPFIYNRMIKGKKFTSGPNKGKWVPFKKIEFQKEDVEKAMSLFKSDGKFDYGFDYRKPIRIAPNVTITFHNAGHISGSAAVLFEIDNDGKKITFVAAGDTGRTAYNIIKHPIADTPILQPPDANFGKRIDFIAIEATYGSKLHTPLEDALLTLEEASKEVSRNRSKLVLPAFSICRTDTLCTFLYTLRETKRLPLELLMYLSSPMAVESMKVTLRHSKYFDEKALKDFMDPNHNPFQFENLIYHKKLDETRKSLTEKIAAAYIASSGMCEFGRIVPILEATINDPKNIIMITGYQAPGTRGYKILNKEPEILFNENIVPLNADVRRMTGLSGHADYMEMIAYLKSMNDPKTGKQFKKIFIKHGEKEACYKLREKLIEAGFLPETIIVMKKGQEYNLE